MFKPAYLTLEDGTQFEGYAYGATGQALGEAVFATGMTGYQETLTDPSYAGQVVMMTAPHIGNTGMNTEDEESRKIWVAGFIVRDPSRIVSNFRSERSLDDDLVNQGIVGISGIDTRALTRHLRDKGAMRCGIFSGDQATLTPPERLEIVLASEGMKGRNLSRVVSTETTYTLSPTSERIGRVAVIDLGVKAATLHYLAGRGFEVVVVPQDTTADELFALQPDAVFVSNGPGDPAANKHQIVVLREVLGRRIPFFGICFGNQILGRALGFSTYKLPFGHRGINQPVLDKLTGRVEITAQNHGFAVDAPIAGQHESPAGFGRVEVSHYSLNDEVVEGLRCLDVPAFSVQYHPEAAAGPHDSNYLFDRFRELVVTHNSDQGSSTTAAKRAGEGN